MYELVKLDVVTYDSDHYMVSTAEERKGYSTKVYPNAAHPRMYYREHTTRDEAIANHDQLVNDLEKGRYKLVRQRFERIH